MAGVDIARNQMLMHFILDHKDDLTGSILDAGCGRSPYRQFFPDHDWTGVDVRPVGDVEADIQSMPFEDESFDTVLCIDVLHQVPHPLAAITEMYRVLKPGGKLVIATRALLEEETGFWAIKGDGLTALCTIAGFKEGSDIFNGQGAFAMGHHENLYTNATKLSDMPDTDRLMSYLDSIYPIVTGVVAVKE